MSTLLFLLITLVSQCNPGFSCPEFTMECYPKTVMSGDTLYIRVIAKNPHAESINIPDIYSNCKRSCLSGTGIA